MKRLFAVVVFSTAAAVSLAGQSQTETPEQGPTFRTGVDLIAVDVSVVDGSGRPVEDLLAPEFTVEIDGEERRVVSAERVTTDVEAARREAEDPFQTLYTTNLQPTNGRQIVIAVDQLGIRFGAARPLLAAAGRFLDRLSPADRVAFVAYPEPGVQVTFTSDHLRLKNAMQRVVGRQLLVQGKHSIGFSEAVAIAERGDGLAYSQVVERECRGMDGFALSQCEDEVTDESSDMVRGIRQASTDSLRGLENLLLALSVIEGPKTLILMSESLILDTPGQLDAAIRAAAFARVTINVLLMDVQRNDVTVRQLSPSVNDDRRMQVAGLENLAAGSRGSLYQIVGTGESVFDRLAGDMLTYYLLGVEQELGDRDGRAHRIDVEVRRRNVTVRSRRAFVLSSPTTTRPNAEETLLDALKSPFGVAEVPLRITTFTQKDSASDMARIVLAAEVGQPGGAPEEFTVGYVLVDSEGSVVASSVGKQVLSVPKGLANAPRDYLGEIVVEPGNYSLRFGVVDASGRRGGVIREVSAWKLGGEEFAIGDLLIGDTADDARGIRPGVEPHVSGEVGAFLELYSTAPGVLDGATVNVEIAVDQDSPALLTDRRRSSPAPSRRYGLSMEWCRRPCCLRAATSRARG